MADPVRLSRFFHSSEIPFWERYDAQEAAAAAEVVRSFLTPIRRRWGPIHIVNGMFTRSGVRRTGAHADPGSFDWVPTGHIEAEGAESTEEINAAVKEVAEWVATHYATDFGELIHEPIPWGGTVTGHIHSTRPGVGSPGAGEYLVEIGPSRFTYGAAHSALLAFMVLTALVLLALTGGYGPPPPLSLP